MCLAIPVQVEQIDEDGRKGVVVLNGNRSEAVMSLVPEAKVGSWVLVHAGHAITVLDDQEARETYELLREANIIE
jgi:hydrogenase expression/formation protein HypC